MKYSRPHLDDHVVVWLAWVSQAGPFLKEGEIYLNRQDHERAARFRFAEDRARFVLGRGLLGQCLGRYLDYPTEPLELAYTAEGRPFLPRDSTTQFSISHGRDLVGVALSRGTLVGIDLEYVAADFNFDEMAERIFSAADLKSFQALPAQEKLPAFFSAWTAKEAYLKAKGVGISEGLREVSVTRLPKDSVCTVTDARDPEDEKKWRLRALPVPADYRGTIAWNDPSKQIDFHFLPLPSPP